jgi:hypothetical protein
LPALIGFGQVHRIRQRPHILLAIAILFGPGETWAYYYWYTALEVGGHALIVLHALKWPKT